MRFTYNRSLALKIDTSICKKKCSALSDILSSLAPHKSFGQFHTTSDCRNQCIDLEELATGLASFVNQRLTCEFDLSP